MRAGRIAALTLSACAALSVGCSSAAQPRHAGDLGAIRANPSPAMHTLAERGTDRTNRHVIVFDNNLRMLSSDIDRALQIDRPSNLTAYPSTRR